MQQRKKYFKSACAMSGAIETCRIMIVQKDKYCRSLKMFLEQYENIGTFDVDTAENGR